MEITNYQFRQSLASLTKLPMSWPVWSRVSGADGMLEDYQMVVDDGRLVCPVDTALVSVLPERLPLYTDVNLKQRSNLLQVLQDRGDEAILAVDAYLGGKESLHLVGLVESFADIEKWADSMFKARINLTIRPINDTLKLIIAPLSSFVPDNDSC